MEPNIISLILGDIFSFVNFMNILMVFLSFVTIYFVTYFMISNHQEIIDNTDDKNIKVLIVPYKYKVNRLMSAFVPVFYIVAVYMSLTKM